MTREEIRLILFLLLAWFFYRGWKRRELTRSVLSLLSLVVVVVLGVFIVYYGKLWHAWIFAVKEMPGAKG